MNSNSVYVGVDVGASRTKVAILDANKQLLGFDIRKSGIDYSETAEMCLASSLKSAQRSRDDIRMVISTGYGRKNVAFSKGSKTEISCFSVGCYFYFPKAITIIDIGGQDNKIIKLDQNGQRSSFKMNRKCAAGTGVFLEEMSMRLNVPLEDMNDIATQSENMVKLGSYCTVFSGTEILEHIRHGKKLPDIVKGVFYSVIRKIMEMDSFTENVVMTGGVVANNPYLVKMTEEILGKTILVAEYPQLTGAIGAAILAMKEQKADQL